jgi:hypothetical protein
MQRGLLKDQNGIAMEIIWGICLKAVEILTLIFGILGMTFSLMMLFSPSLAKNLSNILNRSVSLEKRLEYLDKDIQIDAFVYNHNVLLGALFIGGALFALFFFLFNLDAVSFAKIFFGKPKHTLAVEIIFYSVTWIGKVVCILGIVFGTILMIAPNKLRRIESRLNSWFETKPMIAKLDNSSRDLDTFFFRHPMAFGLIGAIISFFLIVLSIINLLYKNLVL